MADAIDSKDFGKRPESDDALSQQQPATQPTGDVVQMEPVNNNTTQQPADAAPSSSSRTTTQQDKELDPSIPTATGANNNMPVSLQDVMSENNDPVSPASASPTDKQQPADPDSISRASSSSPNTSGNNTEAAAPVCNITLLLPTGARHPYKIDEKYLSKRGVEIPETVTVGETNQPDPFSISVYKLKELILREWREEWEGKPASPTSIRLIHFGKLLDDKESLKSESFPSARFIFIYFMDSVRDGWMDGGRGGDDGLWEKRAGLILAGRWI